MKNNKPTNIDANKVKTPRQIVDMIKNQTQPMNWSKDLRDWYVAEIVDLISFTLSSQKSDLIQKIEEWSKRHFTNFAKFPNDPVYYVRRDDLLSFLKQL